MKNVKPKFAVNFISGIAEFILLGGIVIFVALIVASFYIGVRTYYVLGAAVVLTPIVGLVSAVVVLFISLLQYSLLTCFADLTYYNQCLAEWKQDELEQKAKQ